MPVSKRNGAVAGYTPATAPIPTPQARVLAALVPAAADDPREDWPCVPRMTLASKAGYTALSGSVTRALNGIRPGSSSGPAQLGLVARGLVEEVVLDVEGVREQCYRATEAGVAAYRTYLARRPGGKLPPHRAADISTNKRYLGPNGGGAQ